jgi:hypothetical protein
MTFAAVRMMLRVPTSAHLYKVHDLVDAKAIELGLDRVTNCFALEASKDTLRSPLRC